MTLPRSYRQSIIFLIVTTQVLSPVLVVPGLDSLGGSVFRMILVISGLLFGISVGIGPIGRHNRNAMLVSAALALWMMVSTAWSGAPLVGLREASYVLTVLLLVYVLDVLMEDRRDFACLAKATAAVGLVVIVLSMYEMKTGNHFFRASIQDLAEETLHSDAVLQDQAWFTFGNPNDLAVHLALCSFMATFFVNNLWRFVAWLIYSGWIIYIAIELDARIVIFGMLAFAGVYLTGLMRSKVSSSSTSATALIISAYTVLFICVILRFQAEFLDLSIFIRLQLIYSAVEMGVNSIFIGAGAGDFENTMWMSGLSANTYGIINPHNAMARVFAENGIVGLGLFCYLTFGVIGIVRRHGKAIATSYFVVASVAALPFLLSSGSDPMSSSSLQLAIAIAWVGTRFATGGNDKRPIKEIVGNGNPIIG